jgi:hypothetical protein
VAEVGPLSGLWHQLAWLPGAVTNLELSQCSDEIAGHAFLLCWWNRRLILGQFKARKERDYAAIPEGA